MSWTVERKREQWQYIEEEGGREEEEGPSGIERERERLASRTGREGEVGEEEGDGPLETKREREEVLTLGIERERDDVGQPMR